MRPSQHLSEEQLAWLAMDAMEPPELRVAQAHLAECRPCQAALAEEQAFEQHLRETYAGAAAPPKARSWRSVALITLGLSLAAGALLLLDTQSDTPLQTDPTLGLYVGRAQAQPGADLVLPSELCMDCGR